MPRPKEFNYESYLDESMKTLDTLERLAKEMNARGNAKDIEKFEEVRYQTHFEIYKAFLEVAETLAQEAKKEPEVLKRIAIETKSRMFSDCASVQANILVGLCNLPDWYFGEPKL